MVFERLNVKDDKSTSGDTDKDTFSLPKSRAISDLLLVVRARNDDNHNASNACAAETVLSSIEEIEVKTGDRIFKSYSADIAMAFATYRNGRESYCNLMQRDGNATYPDGWQECAIPISFSRFESDPVCAFPAPLYVNPEISIKYDFELTDATGDTAFKTGASNHRYDLYADMMPHMHEASLRNLKVLEQTKIQNYTSKSAGYDLVNLTQSKHKMLRNVLVRSYLTAVDEGDTIGELAVVVDGQEVAQDTWRRWQNRNAEDCGLDYRRTVETFAEGDHDTYYSTIPDVKATFQAYTTGAEDVYCVTTGDQVKMNGVAADDRGYLHLQSDVIPAVAVIDFDRSSQMNDLLNINVNKLQLRILNSGAGAAVEFYETLVAPAVLD